MVGQVVILHMSILGGSDKAKMLGRATGVDVHHFRNSDSEGAFQMGHLLIMTKLTE